MRGAARDHHSHTPLSHTSRPAEARRSACGAWVREQVSSVSTREPACASRSWAVANAGRTRPFFRPGLTWRLTAGSGYSGNDAGPRGLRTPSSPTGIGTLAATLVLADDDADLRAIYAPLLRAAGHTVHEAADGHEALALVRAHRPAL